MLGWSFPLFRIRGIPLTVHFSFLLLLAYVAIEGWNQAGTEGLVWSVVTLLAFFTCVVLHELGHCFMAMRFGVGVRRILLMPIGGMAEFDEIPRQPARELLITLAGPAVNFALAAGLWLVVGSPASWDLGNYPATLTGFAQLLLHWNLLMGGFNLMPVFPMDGGRICRALLATRLSYVRATFWAATVGKVLAIGAALTSALVFQAYLAAGLFLFIFFAADLEYRTVKRREFEEARWRETMIRLRLSPDDEPPILLPRA